MNYFKSQHIFKDQATDAGATMHPDAIECSQVSEDRRNGKEQSSSIPKGTGETQGKAKRKGKAKGCDKGKRKGKDPSATNR